MKKRYLILTTLLILTIAGLNYNNLSNIFASSDINSNSEVKSDEIVEFNDAAVEAAVAEELNLNVGEITQSDMENLTNINLSYTDAHDLTGLEYAVNLQVLIAQYAEIEDLTPLANLTNLKHINVIRNNVTDITPLENLTNLEILSLTGNDISDISALENLTKLRRLDASSQSISDISVLSNLTELESLMLTENDITDITPLANLTKLQTLSLDENNISDVSALSNLTQLDFLNLDYNHITDISPLANLTKLDVLYVGNQVITKEDIYVDNNNEISTEVIDIKGNPIEVSLGNPVGDKSTLHGNWIQEDTDNIIDYRFGGEVFQDVYLVDNFISAVDSMTINEESEYNDKELIYLFSAEHSVDKEINVDQSSVDYSTPGTYTVVFSAEDTEPKEVELEVRDIKPTMYISPGRITVPQNKRLTPDTSDVEINATEIYNNDLKQDIQYDDSHVDYSTPGKYSITAYVEDSEGNSISEDVSVNVVPESNVSTSSTSVSGSSNNEMDRLNQTGYNNGIYYIAALTIIVIITVLIYIRFKKM